MTRLEEMLEVARLRGRIEAQDAALRMFTELGLPAEGLAVRLMDVNRYLTPDAEATRCERASNVVPFVRPACGG
jgi:hypothetical protein